MVFYQVSHYLPPSHENLIEVHAPSFRHPNKFQRVKRGDRRTRGRQALMNSRKPFYPSEIEPPMSEARKLLQLDKPALLILNNPT
jgi:hypothetical protein